MFLNNLPSNLCIPGSLITQRTHSFYQVLKGGKFASLKSKNADNILGSSKHEQKMNVYQTHLVQQQTDRHISAK